MYKLQTELQTIASGAFEGADANAKVLVRNRMSFYVTLVMIAFNSAIKDKVKNGVIDQTFTNALIDEIKVYLGNNLFANNFDEDNEQVLTAALTVKNHGGVNVQLFTNMAVVDTNALTGLKVYGLYRPVHMAVNWDNY